MGGAGKTRKNGHRLKKVFHNKLYIILQVIPLTNTFKAGGRITFLFCCLKEKCSREMMKEHEQATERFCVKCRDEVSPTSPVRQCSSSFFFCLCNFTSCELSWALTHSVCVFVCLCPFCGYYIIAFFCTQTVCRLSICAESLDYLCFPLSTTWWWRSWTSWL